MLSRFIVDLDHARANRERIAREKKMFIPAFNPNFVVASLRNGYVNDNILMFSNEDTGCDHSKKCTDCPWPRCYRRVTGYPKDRRGM